MAKNKGLTDYSNLSKSKLIRLLNPLEAPTEEALEEKVTEILEEPEPIKVEKVEKPKKEKIKEIKPLSAQAKKWAIHLKQLNISPKDFLVRYPEHIYKAFIEELI